MALNRRCPKCGGSHTQLTDESSKHGCLWTILFGIYYIAWVMVKWMIGLMIFVCYDWWMAMIHAIMGKGHVWQSKKWFSNRERTYYCHDCGCNFRT